MVGAFTRIIGRVLFPKFSKFADTFNQGFINSFNEIDAFDETLKNLCRTWLFVSPSTYFSQLFLEGKEDFIVPFVTAFHGSNMTHAQDCVNISQGYFLRHLKQLIVQDPLYNKFSAASLDHNIKSHMSYGETILQIAKEFEQEISSLISVDGLSICFVEKILGMQFQNESAKNANIEALLLNSSALLGLNIFIVESIKTAKLIDKQNNVIQER